MCGIFCAFGIGNQDLRIAEYKLIDLCREIMSARGPDEFGYVMNEEKNTFMAHSRLAIQGLDSKITQPYKCSDGSILVYNGEVYNKEDLMENADDSGCDTPIFAEMSIRGKKGIERVDGMYAYVRNDTKKGEVIFGRDIFGEKPLKILKLNGIIYIFSEYSYLKIIEYMAGTSIKYDIDEVARYLAYGYRQAKNLTKGISFYEGIKEIKPAAYNTLSLETGIIKEEYINNVKDIFNNKKTVTQDEEEIFDVISEEIAKRCISDAKTGICLSGGIDSNIVMSVLNKSNNPPAKCFTVTSKDNRYNEDKLARKAAEIYSKDHTMIDISRDSLSPIENFINQTGIRNTPFLTMSSFVSTYIAKEAKKENVSVIFGGSGGDEMFSGYYDYFFYRMLNKDYSNEEQSYFEKEIFPFIRNPQMKQGKANLDKINKREHHYYDIDQRMSLFKDKGLIPEIQQECILEGNSRLKQRQYNDLVQEVIPVILHEDDINYMANSIENRSPFLTKKLLTMAISIPDKDLMIRGWQKFILREFLKFNEPRLEDIYMNKKKQGFNYSCKEMISSNKEIMMDLLNENTQLWEILDKVNTIKRIEDGCLGESALLNVISIQALFA